MALGEAQAERERKTPAATTTTTITTATTETHTSIKTMIDNNMANKKTSTRRVAYMAGKDDFRAARMRCALACEEYNKLSEGATAEERIAGWTKIVDPNNKNRETTIITFSDLHKLRIESAEITSQPESNGHMRLCTANRPSAPYVKGPIHVDYGLRLYIAPTTFINRNCFILDTPVADITIGEDCSIGPNVTIIGVGHPIPFEDRCEFKTGKAGSWGARVDIREGVWIGAGVTILPGVTIGEYSTIAAGSVVTKDIPARCMAAGNPAQVRYHIEDRKTSVAVIETAMTLEEALNS